MSDKQPRKVKHKTYGEIFVHGPSCSCYICSSPPAGSSYVSTARREMPQAVGDGSLMAAVAAAPVEKRGLPEIPFLPIEGIQEPESLF